MGRRATRTARLRRYKLTKRRLYRPKVIIKEDLGDVELVETLTFPELERSQSVIPRERNPHLVYIMRHPIRMAFYADRLQCYMYDEDNRYLGKLDLIDLHALCARIQNLIKELAEVGVKIDAKERADNYIIYSPCGSAVLEGEEKGGD